MEREELFSRGVGEDSDIVSKVHSFSFFYVGNVYLLGQIGTKTLSPPRVHLKHCESSSK